MLKGSLNKEHTQYSSGFVNKGIIPPISEDLTPDMLPYKDGNYNSNQTALYVTESY